MPDYDEVARRPLSRRDLDVRASAEVEDEHAGKPENPMQYVDSESLASHNLRMIRKHLGVSQQQISERLPHTFGGMVRLAQTQIAKIERGERPWRVNEMFAIAEALGVEWTELFRGGPNLEGTEDESNDHLIMLGARIRYKQASDRAEEAKEAWIKAATEELKAGRDMARTAAELGIEDPTVMRFLEFRSATLQWMDDEEERIAEQWADDSFPDIEDRMQKSREDGRKAWERLLEEAKKKAEAPDREEVDEPQLGVPPWGRQAKSD